MPKHSNKKKLELTGDQKHQYVEKFYDKTKTLREISNETGFSYKTVRKWKKTYDSGKITHESSGRPLDISETQLAILEQKLKEKHFMKDDPITSEIEDLIFDAMKETYKARGLSSVNLPVQLPRSSFHNIMQRLTLVKAQ